MAEERKFIKAAIRNKGLEEFLAREFAKAGYSHSEIQRTPLSIRITIYAHKPGLVIGRGGKNIEKITKTLKEDFSFENPQLDVQQIENPDLDAHIVSRQMAAAIERGLNYKRVANLSIRRIMESGAAGVAIRVSGKLGGAMGRTEKFSEGYLKYAGESAEQKVDKAYALANVKLGTIGIQVRIMKKLPERMELKLGEESVEEEQTNERDEERGTEEKNE